MPEEKGASIEEYEVVIQINTGLEYSLETISCDGADETIVNSRSCLIPIINLRGAPFNLDYPNTVYAKVRSRNINGWSTFSDVNTEGATILTEPATMG